MNQILKSFLEKLLGSIRIKSKFALFVGLFIATIIYINSPILFGSSLIRLHGNAIIFECPAQFSNCKIYLNKDIEINDKNTFIKVKPLDVDGQVIKIPLRVSKEFNHIHLNNPLKENELIKTAEDFAEITVMYSNNPEVEIIKVLIDDKQIDLKLFFNRNLSKRANEFVDREKIREKIANLLLYYNDSISNYILTFLTLFLFILILNLIIKGGAYYFLPSRYYDKYINRIPLKENIDIEIKKTDYDLQFLQRDNWYRFLQILGPSLGFLLTTSSLIEALNPSVRVARDINTFFDSIQIAMVSTFLGLLIRLVAMLLQKLNNKMLIRFDDSLPENTSG